jgi:succinyl-diaminopimelate desuccinylase
VATRVADEMRWLGFDRAWTDAAGNAIGVIDGRGESAPLMLSCHLDVVDPGDRAAWEYDPYGGEVADGCLHGRGAMDIKGPLAIQTHAAARFVGDPPAGDLIVAHTVLEERGGWGMDHLLSSGDVEPGAVIIGEATGGDICIGHRGRAEVVIEVRGLAGHASAPDRARNALHGVGPVVDAVRGFARVIGVEEDPVLGASTVALTDVAATPASRNVIPDTARIVVDWRVLPGLDRDEALRRLRDFLAAAVGLPDGLEWSVRFSREDQRTWTGLEEARELFGPGFLLPADDPVARAAAGAVERSTGRAPAVRPWQFATDGRYTHGERGIPTIGYAPGEERHAHTSTERLDLAAALEAYTAYPGVIRAVFEVL